MSTVPSMSAAGYPDAPAPVGAPAPVVGIAVPPIVLPAGFGFLFADFAAADAHMAASNAIRLAAPGGPAPSIADMFRAQMHMNEAARLSERAAGDLAYANKSIKTRDESRRN